ncbi:CHAT domain-containing protein [Lentibacter sp. XHP0401]|uniref:CHAT domain-containing protein n=1 Tax=Lentibacter sp. XHP0401 TaxID=2984334 RepID=UPI0021E86BC2|nr:CHAT domain-containing protein [Lentibacter sp. XHP0401]MCV2894627.1 CHAT domain-containing protein [Lentibacter sp. XHP0401]
MRQLFIGLMSAVLGSVCGPQTATAQQQTAEITDWHGTLEQLSCGNDILSSRSRLHDEMLVFASAFSGTSVRQLIVNAEYSENDTAYLLANGLLGLDSRDRVLSRILSANRAAKERMSQDVVRHKDGLCPVLRHIHDTGFETTVQNQEEKRAYWQPHSSFAQMALTAKGCGVVLVDGLFGPASRTIWESLGGNLSARELPSPGDLVALGRSDATCGSAPTVDLTALFELCSSAYIGYDALPEKYASLSGILSGLTAGSGDALLAQADPILRCVFKERNTGSAYLDGALADLGQDGIFGPALTVLTRLPLADVSDWQAMQGLAAQVFPVFSPSGKYVKGEGSMSPEQIAVMARHLMYSGHSAAQQTFGFALLLRSGGGVPLAELDHVLALPFAFEDARTHIAELVDRSLADVNETLVWRHWGTKEKIEDARGSLLLDTHLTLGTAQEFLRDFQAIAGSDLLYDALKDGAHPQLHYAFGAILMEGLSAEGRDPARAAAHFAMAAQSGHAPSMLRLSMMTRYGLGVAQDDSEAQRLLHRAADLGDPTALAQLAEQMETAAGGVRDWSQAGTYYHRAIEKMQPAAAAGLLYGRMLEPSGFWSDGETGDQLLKTITKEALRYVPEDTGQESDTDADGRTAVERKLRRDRYREIAFELGALYADASSGQALDLAQAVRWLRVADSSRQAWILEPPQYSRVDTLGVTDLLSDLVSLSPGLAAHPYEQDFLRTPSSEADAPWYFAPDIAQAQARMRETCPIGEAANDESCLTGLKDAALGFHDPNLIAMAFDHLVAISDAELRLVVQQSRNALQQRDYWAVQNQTAYSAKLVDVLAFYGDYAEAERRARLARRAELSASLGPLRRQVARATQNGQEVKGLEPLLTTLSRQGVREARDLLAVLRGQIGKRATTSDLGVARSRYEAVIHMPYSQALSVRARALAPLEAASGDATKAIELELIALSADLERNRVNSTVSGPLGAALANVCTLSKTSERLVTYGAREAAMVIAKRAVNQLQSTRSLLSTLPENMQLCFRAQVENHYRWLADLMISQNRPQEASRVLEMLKDFESFEFANRAPSLTQDAYDLLPFSQTEQSLLNAMTTIALPEASQTVRLAQLQNLAQLRALTAAEIAELDSLNAAMAAHDLAIRERMDRVIRAAQDVADQGETPDFSYDKLMLRYLENAGDRKSAILQYVVLEDRLGLVLSTGAGQQVWQWDKIDQTPFSESALDQMVADFRTDVFEPMHDPRSMGQRLSDLLLPAEVLEVLNAEEVDWLVLSLDRHLRYLPIAALYSDGKWLAERYTLSHITAGTVPNGALPRSEIIAGFGATQALNGLPALPSVETEVKAVVQENSADQGYISGTAKFDQDFNRGTLIEALNFGGGAPRQTGVLHLASHFKIGKTEDYSALLLGNGDFLSVQDLRTGLGSDADLSQVSLLTLSACETGFGTVNADGSELESVAAIAQDRGAQAVLASVLPVPDGATAALMIAFYRHYAQGLDTAGALQRAQLAVMRGEIDVDTLPDRGGFALDDASVPNPQTDAALNGWAHPRYWAAFILLEGSL